MKTALLRLSLRRRAPPVRMGADLLEVVEITKAVRLDRMCGRPLTVQAVESCACRWRDR